MDFQVSTASGSSGLSLPATEFKKGYIISVINKNPISEFGSAIPILTADGDFVALIERCEEIDFEYKRPWWQFWRQPRWKILQRTSSQCD